MKHYHMNDLGACCLMCVLGKLGLAYVTFVVSFALATAFLNM